MFSFFTVNISKHKRNTAVRCCRDCVRLPVPLSHWRGSRISAVCAACASVTVVVGWISFTMPSGFSPRHLHLPALCVSQCTLFFEASRRPVTPGCHGRDSGLWLADWQLDCLLNSAEILSKAPASRCDELQVSSWALPVFCLSDGQAAVLIHFSLRGPQWGETVDSLSVGLLCNSDWMSVNSVCHNPNWRRLREVKWVLCDLYSTFHVRWCVLSDAWDTVYFMGCYFVVIFFLMMWCKFKE